jgi:hypothetical protein
VYGRAHLEFDQNFYVYHRAFCSGSVK